MHIATLNRIVDVAVLGGGPAGLATALALRQQGLHVAVYDALRPPIDKTCGEGLMPEAVRLLAGFGIPLETGEAALFRGISFHNAHTTASATFTGRPGYGVRRTMLHSRMAARAADQGVECHWETSVRRNDAGDFTASGAPIVADFFVIADGLCSTLAAAAGFRERRCHSVRYASRQHFACVPWNDAVEVHWGDREQLYVTPLGEQEVGVALITHRPDRRLRDALPDFPAVARQLAGVAASSAARGAVTKTRRLRQLLRGNIAVLGDASGSVDAVTGEGLLAALRQAAALADAVAAGQPQRYAAAHRAMDVLPQRMARALLLMDRYPWLQRRMIAAFAARPDIFAAMLRMHLGEESFASFAIEHGMALGHAALTASIPPPTPWFGASPRRERGL